MIQSTQTSTYRPTLPTLTVPSRPTRVQSPVLVSTPRFGAKEPARSSVLSQVGQWFGAWFAPPGPLTAFNNFKKQFDALQMTPQAFIEHVRSQGPFLGHGTSARVYDIPGMPDFVMRIPKSKFNPPDALYSIDDILPNRNVGQRIATLGKDEYGEPVVQILKKQKGIPLDFIVRTAMQQDPPPVPVESVSTIDGYDRFYLGMIERMPQSAFDDLAVAIREVDQAGFSIDPYCLNNLLLDEQGQRLNLVDLSEKGRRDRAHPDNSLQGMIVLMLDWRRRVHTETDNPTVQTLERSIFDKSIRAAIKAGLPVLQPARGKSDTDEANFVFKRLMRRVGRETQWPELKAQLESRTYSGIP